MTPLLACIPVCLTFVSIAIIGLVVVIFGLSNHVPADDPHDDTNEAPVTAARPPLWVFPLVLLAAILLLLAMSQVWTD